MENRDKQKIILVGAGAVGSSYAFALVNQNIGKELGIIDLNHGKSEGDAIDLSDGLAYTSPKKIYAATYDDCHDADLVVITAGATNTADQTRMDLLHINLKITKDIVDSVMASGFDGMFLVANNPVDIMAYAVQKFSGLPASRVIGSGTTLDSARFKKSLAEIIQADPRDIQAYIIGEHGDTQFPVWSHANIGGLQVYEWVKKRPEVTEESLIQLVEDVRDAGYRIIERKGSTYYGIAISLARITKAIFDDEHAILPLSVQLNGQYGASDLYIGSPAVITREGIQCVIEIPLNDMEQQKMQDSIHAIQQMIDEVF